jgi:hypothetical protein
MMQTIRWLFGVPEPHPTILDKAIEEHTSAIQESRGANQRAASMSRAIIRDTGATMQRVAKSWDLNREEPPE